MIACDALAAWLADIPRQRRSLYTTNEYARYLARHPLLDSLRQQVRTLEPRTANAMLALARSFLARHKEMASLVEELAAAAARDPYFRPPLAQSASEVSSGLVLFDDADLWVALGVTRVDDIAAWKTGRSGAASISFPGYVSLLHFVKAGGATLSFWEAPAAGNDFEAARGVRCRFVGRRAITDGETLAIDGRRQSFVFEHAVSDIVHVQAQIRIDPAPLAVEYDSETMDYVGASSTDEASSRTQMMISLLRLMERADAIPLFEEALKSPHFYTRWHVMREYLALEAQAALPSLSRMAIADTHPEVRAAATRTLDAFFGAEPEKSLCHA